MELAYSSTSESSRRDKFDEEVPVYGSVAPYFTSFFFSNEAYEIPIKVPKSVLGAWILVIH